MHSIKEKSFIFVLVGGCDELVGSESLSSHLDCPLLCWMSLCKLMAPPLSLFPVKVPYI